MTEPKDAIDACPICEEAARLRRALAVEAGDESQAPRGWRVVDGTTWRRGDVRIGRIAPCSWRWYLASERGGGRQSWPTALEAMGAADAANPREETP